jgi:hypothetical protein
LASEVLDNFFRDLSGVATQAGGLKRDRSVKAVRASWDEWN